MISISDDASVRSRLETELRASGLTFLAALFVPTAGGEGQYLEVGAPLPGLRHVIPLEGPKGRLELHAQGAELPQHKALELLNVLESLHRPWLAERLHDSVCQALTAAHLQVEFATMTHPDNSEFATAKHLVSEANKAVRELIDTLAGETA